MCLTRTKQNGATIILEKSATSPSAESLCTIEGMKVHYYIERIREFIEGYISFDLFQESFYVPYMDDDDFEEEYSKVFSEICDKLDFTSVNLTKQSIDFGFIDEFEFKKWLKEIISKSNIDISKTHFYFSKFIPSKKWKFEVVFESNEIGWYIYVYDKDGNCTHDYLQDTFENAKEFIEEEFKVTM